MDSLSFPHILDLIVHFAADMYAASTPAAPAKDTSDRPEGIAKAKPLSLLGLRGTSLHNRDLFDSRLGLHVARKDQKWFTPGLRHIPALQNVVDVKDKDGTDPTTSAAAGSPANQLVQRLLELTRVLDDYDRAGALRIPRNLKVFRSTVPNCPPLVVPTYLAHLGPLDPFALIHLPNASRAVIRLPTADLYRGWMYKDYGFIHSIPPTLRELVFLVDPPAATVLHIHPPNSIRPLALQGRFVVHDQALSPKIVISPLGEWVRRGGRIVLVIKGETGRSLKRAVEQHLVDLERLGQAWRKILCEGLRPQADPEAYVRKFEEAWDAVKVDEAAFQCQGDVVTLGWDEWVKGATDIELDWLDQENIERRSDVHRS